MAMLVVDRFEAIKIQEDHCDALATPILFDHCLAQAIIKKEEKVGIITASKQSLTPKHLAGVGVQKYPVAVIGMDGTEEFATVFIEGKETIDVEMCREEMVAVAGKLIKRHPDVGAIVLECTNMPPYAKDIQQATGRPVFDVVTMINYAYAAVVKKSFV